MRRCVRTVCARAKQQQAEDQLQCPSGSPHLGERARREQWSRSSPNQLQPNCHSRSGWPRASSRRRLLPFSTSSGPRDGSRTNGQMCQVHVRVGASWRVHSSTFSASLPWSIGVLLCGAARSCLAAREILAQPGDSDSCHRRWPPPARLLAVPVPIRRAPTVAPIRWRRRRVCIGLSSSRRQPQTPKFRRPLERRKRDQEKTGEGTDNTGETGIFLSSC